MNDERRIITPQEFLSRQNRRAGLVDINKRLVRELDISKREIAGRDLAIQAMNSVFTKLAQIVGTPLPESAEAAGNCLEALTKRVQDLAKADAEKSDRKD